MEILTLIYVSVLKSDPRNKSVQNQSYIIIISSSPETDTPTRLHLCIGSYPPVVSALRLVSGYIQKKKNFPDISKKKKTYLNINIKTNLPRFVKKNVTQILLNHRKKNLPINLTKKNFTCKFD